MLNKLTRCWAEIDSTALISNIALLRNAGPAVMAVVKADAYGHDLDLVVPTLRHCGIEHFAVATVEEAAELHSLLRPAKTAIYLMAAVLAEEAPEVVRLGLIPFASDTTFVRALSAQSMEQNKPVSVHIEVDTGIGRAGIAPDRLRETITLWNSLPGISVTGICTHFTAADALSPADALDQQMLFEWTLAKVPAPILGRMAIHAANSPAALRVPFRNAALFRPGLLLYGIAPSLPLARGFPYSPILSLKARVLLVRELPAGTDISYSRTYRLPQEAAIATIGIGYGDGYPRRLSNAGKVLLPDGSFAFIRGRICMDQICIEVPKYSPLAVGDTVTLIGRVGKEEITVAEIAAQIDATPHEITTCLTTRIPRTLSNTQVL